MLVHWQKYAGVMFESVYIYIYFFFSTVENRKASARQYSLLRVIVENRVVHNELIDPIFY